MSESMTERILDLLKRAPGLKAREIARLLGYEKRSVNQVLYGQMSGNYAYRDDYYCWFPIQPSGVASHAAALPIGNKDTARKSEDQIRQVKRAITTIYSIVDYVLERSPDNMVADGYNQAPYGDMDDLYHDVDRQIFDFCLELTTDSYDIEEWEFDLLHDKLEPFFKYVYFEYYSHIASFEGFRIGYEEYPGFLDGIILYDDQNDTCFAELLIRCFEIIGGQIQLYFQEELETSGNDPQVFISLMREYVAEQTAPSDEAEEEGDDDDEDDDDDDYDEDEDDDDDDYDDEDEDDDYDEDAHKEEIEESCLTCRRNQDGSCTKRPRIYENCNLYLYFK